MKPIANKYREGKLKRTLERELKGRETIWKEADRASGGESNSDQIAAAGAAVDLCRPCCTVLAVCWLHFAFMYIGV